MLVCVANEALRLPVTGRDRVVDQRPAGSLFDHDNDPRSGPRGSDLGIEIGVTALELRPQDKALSRSAISSACSSVVNL